MEELLQIGLGLFGGLALFLYGMNLMSNNLQNGAWNGAVIKSTQKKDLIISLICVGIFSFLFYLIIKKNMAALQAAGISVCFFVILSALSFVLLRGLSCLSQRKSDKLKDGNAL